MNYQEIKKYAESLGAAVFIKSFDSDDSNETVCINIGPVEYKELEDLRGWKYAIFINRIKGGWKLKFSQYGATRRLTDDELKRLIKIWIQDPNDDHFKEYEMT